MKSYLFFKIWNSFDKERVKTLMQQSMRKKILRKVGLCSKAGCFIKSFNMIINHFLILQVHSQPNICFFDIRMTQEISKGEFEDDK